jgi:hypothetical protein
VAIETGSYLATYASASSKGYLVNIFRNALRWKLQTGRKNYSGKETLQGGGGTKSRIFLNTDSDKNISFWSK